jgi:hypothetical protein
VQAIVAAFGLDERTVSAWLHRAGDHAQRVHEEMMGHQALDLGQVQGDEIRVKTQGGVVSAQRNMRLAQRLAAQVRHVLPAPFKTAR